MWSRFVPGTTKCLHPGMNDKSVVFEEEEEEKEETTDLSLADATR